MESRRGGGGSGLVVGQGVESQGGGGEGGEGREQLSPRRRVDGHAHARLTADNQETRPINIIRERSIVSQINPPCMSVCKFMRRRRVAFLECVQAPAPAIACIC